MTRTQTNSTRRTAEALRRPVQALAAKTAVQIARARRRLRPGDVRRKGVGDFVTRVDIDCERSLRRALAALLPEAGFLGEETDPTALDRDWLWVVDPIDGTSNFARGLVHFAVSIALLWQGQPHLAVLHCAPEDACYAAVLGAGARRNGRRIQVPPTTIDDGSIIGCQWHRGQQDLAFVARLQRPGCRIRTFGCTVTQLMDVAMGRLDANVQEQGRIWDIAAAGLVVAEAGGCFTTWTGAPVFPFRDLTVDHTPTLAAAPAVHATLVALLGEGLPLVVSQR
jgi:myo-inositol-1(or 4)-monophosphatase